MFKPKYADAELLLYLSINSNCKNDPPAAKIGVKQKKKKIRVSRKKYRKRTTSKQLKVLEKHFKKNPLPERHIKEQLAIQLKMTYDQIQNWYQNKRSRVKKLNR
jgi:hypothetical protein